MLYVNLQGSQLSEAIGLRPTVNGDWPRAKSRMASKLQKATGIDSDSFTKLLSGSGSIPVPLYALALLARAIGTTVEYLLVGVDQTDDPNVISPVDEVHIQSANSFIEFLDRFHVDFPLALWDYAFPRHRKGAMSALRLSDWTVIYREKYGNEPEGIA